MKERTQWILAGVQITLALIGIAIAINTYNESPTELNCRHTNVTCIVSV